MAFKLADGIQDTATTPVSGTGISTVTGTAPPGSKTFSSYMSIGDTTWLTRRMGSDFETGVFTYTAANELTPTQIFESTNGNAAVVWGAGIKTIFCDLPASKARKIYAFEDTTEATGAGTTAAALFAGGVEIAKKLFVSGLTTLSSALSINATTPSTSPSTGALVVGGGAGVGGNLNVGGNVNIAGTLTLPVGVGGYRETFTGTAGQTSITTTYGYTNGQIDVYRGGVRQTNGVDVTVSSGTTLVFAAPLSAGEIIDVVYYTLAPLTGSTQSIYQDTFTASSGQTIINPSYSYSTGSLIVFVNGIKQVVGVDYSAPGGNAITMSVAFVGGEKIELVYWQLASITSTNTFSTMGFGGGNKSLIVNGFIEYAQDTNGNQQTLVTSTPKYTIDQFVSLYIHGANTAVIKSGMLAVPGTPGFGNGIKTCLQVIATTAMATVAAGDYVSIYQPIEGTRTNKLGYGASAGMPIVVGFWVNSTTVGTGTLSIRNSSTTRSYVADFTINNANTWEYKTILVPPDVTGTWLTDTGIGMIVSLCFAAGSTFRAASNATWSAGNFIGTPNTTNFFASNNNQVLVTGLTVLPGSDVVPSNYMLNLRAPSAEEYQAVRRYFQRWASPPLRGVVDGTASVGRFGMSLPTPMRIKPVPTIVSALQFYDGGVTGVVSSIRTDFSNTDSIEYDASSTGSTLTLGRAAVSYQSSGILDLNARM